ncbi:MAG: NAD(P)H-dependent oxidoreductase subunit E [Phycisphaerae bacterium]|nr:NAD(P)H-dependent oxidoreductase subunit E [Phycisphaerae bacterium]
MSDVDVSIVDAVIERTGGAPDAVVPICQQLQEHYGYLPAEALERVCARTEIPPAQLTGVSTFYAQFRHRPVGRHIIRVCHGTACHVKGAAAVHETLCKHLHLAEGQDTDADGLFTVQKVACLGCCTLAPAVQIGEVTYGHLTADDEAVAQMLHDFLTHERRGGRRRKPRRGGDGSAGEVRIGLGSCCVARGSGKVYEAFERALGATGAAARVKRVGCVGLCHQTPLVEIAQPGRDTAFYARVQPEDAEAIIERHFRARHLPRRVVRRVSRALDRLLTDETWRPVTRYTMNVRDEPVAAFLDKQQHLATEHCGFLDPLDLDEYLARDGYVALRRCIEALSPRRVVQEIDDSGLRGRGGAGYPTGLKWRHVHDAPGAVKYVVCNGDEGDPGAFMDRMLLESYPYRVLEGLTIAAYAVGACEAHLYVRAEYPLAVARLGEAIARAGQRGLLGERICGSDASLTVTVHRGAGAFVCGEETALLASIQGRRGMPRLRPPYPARQGLWGRPTLINNVETYALVPWILRHGANAFAAIGREASKGTKVFALAGKVARGGLIEVPMGITLREIVEDIGGGVADGRRFKAVQIGGPSGGCVPAELSETPVDYEALQAVGGIMGSGGLVVLDETDCMVEIARYFLEFTQDQSCGRCTPCRVGTRRMLEILTRLCEGDGRDGDLDRLEQLAEGVRRGSLCALGRTAPNPVVSTLAHFRDEYEAHLAGHCPAGRCRALIAYTITDDCIGCTRCAQHCPADAIASRPHERHEIDTDKCVRCGTCRSVCPADAVCVE